MTDHELYANWDAAYVLGALSAPERHEFEQHLDGCARCAGSVAELAAMPALLGMVEGENAKTLLTADSPNPTDATAPARAGRASHEIARRVRRRRMRMGLVGAGSALVGAVVAIVVAIALTTAAPRAVGVALQPVASSALSATVELDEQNWGVRLEMTCTYHGSPGASYAQPAEYGLFVVRDDGETVQVSSWNAAPGETVHTTGSIAGSVDRFDELQVRDRASGSVLLVHEFSQD